MRIPGCRAFSSHHKSDDHPDPYHPRYTCTDPWNGGPLLVGTRSSPCGVARLMPSFPIFPPAAFLDGWPLRRALLVRGIRDALRIEVAALRVGADAWNLPGTVCRLHVLPIAHRE